MLALPMSASRLTRKELSHSCQSFPFLWISISSSFLAGLCFQALPQFLMALLSCQTGKGHLVQISGKSNILYFFSV